MADPIFMLSTNWGVKFIQAPNLELALSAVVELVTTQITLLYARQGEPRSKKELAQDLADLDIYDTKLYRDAQFASVTKIDRPKRRRKTADKKAAPKKMSAETRAKISMGRRRFERNKKLLAKPIQLTAVPEPIHES